MTKRAAKQYLTSFKTYLEERQKHESSSSLPQRTLALSVAQISTSPKSESCSTGISLTILVFLCLKNSSFSPPKRTNKPNKQPKEFTFSEKPQTHQQKCALPKTLAPDLTPASLCPPWTIPLAGDPVLAGNPSLAADHGAALSQCPRRAQSTSGSRNPSLFRSSKPYPNRATLFRIRRKVPDPDWGWWVGSIRDESCRRVEFRRSTLTHLVI